MTTRRAHVGTSILHGALAIGACLALVGCPSTSTPPDSGDRRDGGGTSCTPATSAGACRGNADCMGLESCVAPGEQVGCGICMEAPRQCEADADCASPDGPRVCERVFYPCAVCRGDGWGTSCIPACEATSCSAGSECGADGHCTPIRCTDGYACPPGTSCTAAGDEHGCERASCTSDGDCPCGTACVEQRCHETLGRCESARP